MARAHWSRRVVRHDGMTCACQTRGMACSNCGFVGCPIALLIVAPIVGVMLRPNMMVEDQLLMLLLLVLAESGEGRGGPCATVKPQKTIKIGHSRIWNVR